MALGFALPVQVGDSFRLGNTELTILGKTKIVQRNCVNDDGGGIIESAPIDPPQSCCLIS